MASAAEMVPALPVAVRRWAAGPAEGFIDVADLASAEEPVGVEVAAVVAGQRFGEGDRRDLRGPEPAPPQLGQAGSLACQRADAAGVQNEGHVAPDSVPAVS
jgi:hypothetical protein